MKIIVNRTLKVLCLIAATLALVSCGGATSTVDPFHPTRVIGLGDAYNDTTSASLYTVRGTGTVETVVAQVAAFFGVSNIDSKAVHGATISSLTAQIASVNSLSSTDLVVVAVGSQDIQNAYSAATFDATASNAAAEAAAVALVDQIKSLLTLGARHILVMQPLEFSLTPLAGTNRTKYPLNYDSSPTVKFNTKVVGDLQAYVSAQGYVGNPVIYGGAGLSSTFNSYASLAVASVFANANTPWCTGPTSVVNDPANTAGCDSNVTNLDGNYLFADGVNLTPAGNRWVASYLYNATAQGWR